MEREGGAEGESGMSKRREEAWAGVGWCGGGEREREREGGRIGGRQATPPAWLLHKEGGRRERGERIGGEIRLGLGRVWVPLVSRYRRGG